MTKPTGFVIYKGPSLSDGAPIVVVATIKSKNGKTGNMVQTWIIRSDMSPLSALAGADVSICGDCVLRPANGGGCYVNVGKAPSRVFAAFQRGRYIDISDSPAAITAIGRNRENRFGAYGDPMAVPVGVWNALDAESAGRTGYTHQWHNLSIAPAQRAGIMRLCMASVNDPAEQAAAKALGSRTFRVRLADEPLLPREFACPASPEGGDSQTCQTCLACNGAERPKAADAAIVVHGPSAKRYITMRLIPVAA